MSLPHAAHRAIAQLNRRLFPLNKRLSAVIIAVPAAIYAGLSAFGLAGLSAGTGGFVYRILIIAALLFSCSRAFAAAVKSGDRGALLTAALGMGTFAVNEIYVFAYIYLLRGDASDITVANYSRNCAYLFFIAAVLLLLPGAGKALRNLVSAAGFFQSEN